MIRFGLAALGVAALAPALAGAPLSAADLLRRPDVVRAHLAPDGKHVILVSGDVHGSLTLFDVASDTRAPLKVTLNVQGPPTIPTAITDANWVGPARLLLAANIARLPPSINVVGPLPTNQRGPPGGVILPPSYSGFSAVDLDGKQLVNLPGLALRSDTVPGSAELPFLWDARRIFFPIGQPGVVFAPAHEGSPGPHPLLAKIDTQRGTASRFFANPGTITEWLPDPTGRVVFGVDGSGATTLVLGQEKATGKWIQVADLGAPRPRLRLEGLDATRGLLYASRLMPEGRWALCAFNLATRQWLEPLLQNPRYDIAPEDFRGTYASLDLTDLVFSPKTGRLVAFGIVVDGPRQVLLDERVREAVRGLQAASPDLTTYALELDDTESRLLTFSWSSRDPGFYSVVDLATKKATRLADRMDGFKAADFGETLTARVKARDGTELDTYLTLPPSGARRQLPLVVLVREHPWQRDLWGFQPLVQFLATRGYAVLQVNHRGSSGYGEAFLNAGREDFGVVPRDLADATRWVIAQGIADPRRVAVVGTSFGGYGALMALDREPEVFRCGVALNAVTDWSDLFRHKSESAYRYWFETNGVLPGDRSEERLRRNSPGELAAHLRAPLLLVHSESEVRAPIRGAKTLASALKKQGRPIETFFYDSDRFDRSGTLKKQIEVHERLAAFLARSLSAVASAR